MKWRAAVACAFAAVLLAYANHFHNSFQFDDAHTIEQNLYLRDLRNVPRFFASAQTFSVLPTNQSYRPILSTTLAVDYALGGLDPSVFHLDSFCWFLAQLAVMLLLFRRILAAAGEPDDRARWLALFGTALFGLHAAIAETVNYISARSDILSALGAVATVAVWAASPRARRFGLYLLPAALGVLAKEQGAMAAPLLFLYVALIDRQLSLRELCSPRAAWSVLRSTWPAFVTCGALGALSMRMAQSWAPGGSLRLFYALTQPFVVLHYAVMFVAPVQLSADSNWHPVATVFDLRVLAGAAFLAALLALAWRSSRSARTRPIAFGVLWFLVALLPTSSVVPLAEVMNDHRMYFPFVGLAVALASGTGLLLEKQSAVLRPAIPAALVGVLVAHGIGARLRNEVWRDKESLWRDVVAKSPDNARGWMNYGLARMVKRDYDEAERCFRRGLQLAPAYGYLHVNLAVLRAERGDAAEAEKHFRAGLVFMPHAPALRYFYARWLDQVGRAKEAIPQLRQEIAESPGDAAARRLLMKILAEAHAWSELADVARDTLRFQADDTVATSLLRLSRARLEAPRPPEMAARWTAPEMLLAQSLALYEERKYEEALRAGDAALALRPAYAEAHNNRCAALNALQRYREAAIACAEALRIDPTFERARNNLVVARRGLAAR
jgi:tetratricopeptide (TPR) repeat protein